MNTANEEASNLLKHIRDVTGEKKMASYLEVYASAYDSFDMEKFNDYLCMLRNTGVIDLIKIDHTFYLTLFEGKLR